MLRSAPFFALLLPCLVGCHQLVSHEELVEESFATRAKPTVIVDTFNGAIDVKSEGQALLLAKVFKRGSGATPESARADCEQIEVSITEEPGNVFRIVAKRPDGSWMPRGGARIEILVPVEATLELKSSNGTINVEGNPANITARTSNGAMHAKGGRGRRELKTSNGRIEVEAEQAELKLESSNGRLRFVGSLAAGNHLLASSNGSVDVQIPESSSFQLDASTSNGRIRSAFEFSKSEKSKRGRLAGTVGKNPEATLKITTSNGSIDIEGID